MDTIEHEGREYRVVDAKEYAQSLIDNGAETLTAVKSGAVIARKVEHGRTFVDTYTSNGNCEVNGEEAKEGSWILTRANLDGSVYHDQYGHENSWVVKSDTDEHGNITKSADEKMAKKYDMEHIAQDGFVKPKGGPQHFIQVDQDVAFMVPWGKGGAPIPQYVLDGGFLNVTSMDDIYGIAEEEFGETYQVIDEPQRAKKKESIQIPLGKRMEEAAAKQAPDRPGPAKHRDDKSL